MLINELLITNAVILVVGFVIFMIALFKIKDPWYLGFTFPAFFFGTPIVMFCVTVGILLGAR